ncbi:MAG TPA: LamG-like jellyroll fold domain-containing protein, partial [Candidatus Sulfotelmatobacter sp.]|nr:LamG-like jellyroll fold domain-containing protein [Candidatus Sulfotelmatobacter sp.]
VGLAPMVTEGRNNIGSGNYAGFSLGQYQNKFYFTLYNTNGSTAQPEIDITSMVSNKWYHIVVTFDGTNETIFANGAQAQTKALTAKNGAGLFYVPDLISPLLIGCGTQLGAANGGAPFPGILDEVAIYTNVLTLTQIQNHYNATNSGYATAVLIDNPGIYLRLNEPAFAGAPAPSSYPVANNYGSLGAAAQGLYQPGTMPGVPGPAYTGFGSASTAVALNGFNAGVDVGGGSLPAQLNPTGKQPVTVMTWFKGNPADCAGRFQTLLGHGDLSWRLALDNNGGVRFNPGAGPELQFSSTQDLAANNIAPNDGNWHFAAGVSDGTNDFLYLDGVLVKAAANVGNIVGTNADLMLGGDIQYTAPQVSGGGGGRFFDGSIAHVAFFTNALSATQIQQVYTAAGNIPPTIRVQPVSQTTFAGQSAALAATVAGASPISYQWYKNTSAVSGRTAASTQFNPVTASDAGSYFLVASNPYGSVTSAIVQLTVTGSASPYAATVQGLGPVAYWPLSEATQPPQPLNLTAQNLGSLGTVGNGFYGAWYQPLGTSFYITNNIISSNGITFAADGSKGLACQRQPGQYVIIPRNTNGVANPAVTITPPFSIEVWAFVGSTNIGNMNLISQGQANQNSGGADNTNSWAGFALGQYQDYFYFSCFCTNGLSKNSELDSSGYNTRKGFNTNQWVHVVATFDGTTEQIYTNGVLATYKTVAANAAGLTYVPDPTSPLMIGGGNVVSGGGAAGAFSGVLDEVAIYPSVLSQQSIQTHYETAYGTNAIYNNAYTNAVLADSPSLYYRFDDLQSRIGAGYPANTFPVAANYGLLGSAANGVYQPGTTP